MMKKIHLTFCLLIACFNFINGQENNNTIKYNHSFKEKIFVHYNSSLLVTGEYLQYKIYSIRDRNNKISRLSKIAYIELISSSKKVIFKHKIRLQKGIGSGEFFVPASIKTGNYKLISYTQAMRNEGESYFFQGNISIINPFQAIEENAIVENATIEDKNIITINKLNKSTKNAPTNNLKIITPSNTYKTRSKVSLSIKETNNSPLNGNYSISVRKLNNINKPETLTSKNYSNVYPEIERKTFYETKFIPEFEGDLIIGTVIDKNTQKPAKNIKVALSIPSDNQVLKFAQTDVNGNFIYKLKAKFSASNATIQVLGEDRNNYTIKIKKTNPKDYSNLVFNNFKITPNTKEIILESSIQNQIENSYQSIKLDSISDKKNLKNYFFNKNGETFILDDYTRFPTVKETLIEVVKNARTKKRRGNYSFHVTKLNPYDKEDLKPIVIVDGVLAQDLNRVAEFDAKKVKSINIVRDKFYYGDFKFQGIISINTFDNDYNNTANKSYVNNFSLFTPIKDRKYYSQEYNESNKYDRIPDYRKQLLWDPNITINNNKEISFFTSDVKGVFEISIEGFLNDGTPISSKKIITVN